MNETDRRVIACNYLESTSICRRSALAYISVSEGGEIEKVCVLARSRSGRWICRWEWLHLLSNFRLKTLPPEHPRYADARIGSRIQCWVDRLQYDSDQARLRMSDCAAKKKADATEI